MNKFFNGSLDPDTINKSIDKFINNSIKNAIQMVNTTYNYSRKDLDEQINEDETLREYLTDGCDTFGLIMPELDSLNDSQLNSLIQRVDECWDVALRKV